MRPFTKSKPNRPFRSRTWNLYNFPLPASTYLNATTLSSPPIEATLPHLEEIRRQPAVRHLADKFHSKCNLTPGNGRRVAIYSAVATWPRWVSQPAIKWPVNVCRRSITCAISQAIDAPLNCVGGCAAIRIFSIRPLTVNLFPPFSSVFREGIFFVLWLFSSVGCASGISSSRQNN